MEFLTSHRLESDGIQAYVENGTIYECDDSNVFEFPDTAENRENVIADIFETIERWKN